MSKASGQLHANAMFLIFQSHDFFLDLSKCLPRYIVPELPEIGTIRILVLQGASLTTGKEKVPEIFQKKKTHWEEVS